MLLTALLLPLVVPPQVSPTLLVDLDDSPTAGVFDGQVLVLGEALGRLWLTGERAGIDTRLWTLDTVGATPQPELLLPAGGSPLTTLAPAGVVDLENGRALLIGALGSDGTSKLHGTDGTPTGIAALDVTLVGNPLRPFGLGDVTLVGAVAFFVGEVDGAQAIYGTDGTKAGTIAWTTTSGGAETIDALAPLAGALVYARRSATAVELRHFAPGSSIDTLLATTDVLDQPLFDALETGGRLVFAWSGDAASASAHGEELWSTDGSSAGTVMLSDTSPGPADGAPRLLSAAGQVFFSSTTPTTGRELWTTDGTASGTSAVVDLAAGAADGLPLSVGPAQAAAAGGLLVFRGSHDGIGTEPHVSDGTAAGTGLLADLSTQLSGSQPLGVTAVGDRVLFSANREGFGREAFATDGSTVTPLGDLEPGAAGCFPLTFREFGGQAYFSAAATSVGRELFAAPLTPAGPASLAADIGQDFENVGSEPERFVAAGDRAYFITDFSAPLPSELYVTDGTAAGTVRLATTTATLGGALPLAPLGRGLVFSFSDGNGSEPWFTDGTPAGTIPLADLQPGALGSNPFEGVELGGDVYFLATTTANGREIWRTDGTPAGTALAIELVPGPSSSFTSGADLRVHDDVLYVIETIGHTSLVVYESPVWASDGTTAGTQALLPGQLGTTRIYWTRPFGERLLIAERYKQELGVPPPPFYSLWATDGTDAGTELLRAGTGLLFGVEVVGERVVFIEVDESAGHERLLALEPDGTVVTLVSIPTATGNIALQLEAGVGGGAYFSVEPNGAIASGTWFTDGTVQGTAPIAAQIARIGPAGSGREAILSQITADAGRELWHSDGTAGGTQLFADVAPGITSSSPEVLGAVGGRLLFAATTAEHGTELHAVDLTALGAWLAAPFGQGCGVSGLVDLTLTGEPRPGQPIAFEVDDASPLSPALLFVGFGATGFPLGPCDVFVAPTVPLATALTDPLGALSIPLTVPAGPALVGQPLFAQGAVVAAGGPALGSLETTNALTIVVGP